MNWLIARLIPIMDQVPMRVFAPDDLPQLLQRPGRARTRGHIHMGQAARPVLDYHEHIRHPESRSHSNEEVTREIAFA